ncbi:MAG TPA: menaquinone biosynthesis decarboxylase [Candidatus Methylacidiphilales bacterium]|jgi:4-hydroxy-3-polyprenylbenzoate decarboxylase|nr:menaquinone biosynthesis decarboxylase [Candidatus Methylacidiphilales bacterium]
MAYSSMREFADTLEKTGELVRISEPVRTELEITALANREMKSPGGGKALLIEKPVLPSGKISAFPVLINAFGSEKRMALSLEVKHVDEVADQIAFLLKAKPPRSLGEAWDLLRAGFDAMHAKPARVRTGPCKDVIVRLDQGATDFDLNSLPALKSWPKDGGPFLTLPTVYTQDPDTGDRNIGMYRMQIYDGRTTGMHWQMHKVAARHGKRYVETGQRMPVAVCLGGDPVMPFCATAPMPDGLDEVLLAGFLRKKSVPLVKCETIDLEVPAHSDFVIEGYVDPTEPLRPEGPFGDHTGFYTPIDNYPAFHVTCITHRRDAIYPATIVGKPPMEDLYMGHASVRLFLPIFKMNFPEIVDMALPAEGVFHNLVFVSIKKQYPYQAYKIMHGLWGMGQMMFTKIIVVVDATVNVHDTSDVLFHLCANIDPQRDSLLTKGPCDSLDHAPTLPNIGSHIGFDATTKLPGEGYTRGWPEEMELPGEILEGIAGKFPRKW